MGEILSAPSGAATGRLHIQAMDRKRLVGITGSLSHADGQEEVQVVGDEVWEEWTGSAVEDIDWRRGRRKNGQPRRERFHGGFNSEMWTGTKYVTKGDRIAGLEKGEPWAPCCCFVCSEMTLVIVVVVLK